MNIIIIILTFIVLLISIMLLYILSPKNDTGARICYIISLICVSILAIYVGDCENSKEIPAIEVYRGNTTLQITYQDSIPIDTTVVYKNK